MHVIRDRGSSYNRLSVEGDWVVQQLRSLCELSLGNKLLHLRKRSKVWAQASKFEAKANALLAEIKVHGLSTICPTPSGVEAHLLRRCQLVS